MKQYLDILREVRQDGEWKENRTGIRTQVIDGACARYDLRMGFPAVTTKRLAFNATKGEVCGMLRGFTSAADFRDFGCKVWDQNANENQAWLKNPFRKGKDDLGVIYGAQWRSWHAFKKIDDDHPNGFNIASRLIKQDGWDSLIDNAEVTDFAIYHKEIDQIRECITKIIKDPDNRRNLFHAWNPAVLDEIALPACHLLYQFMPNKQTREMSLVMYQRSCDMFLGVPFNIAGASLLLSIICHLTGYTPKNFVHMMADVHIYESHLAAVDEQLAREPIEQLPKLVISGLPTYRELQREADAKFEVSGDQDLYQDLLDSFTIDLIMKQIDNLRPDMFSLEGYEHHPALTAPMAV